VTANVRVRAKPVTFLHEINHCCTVISHVQLLNSYCLKTTHRVECRTDAVNNLSRSLENHFIEANIHKNIRIKDTAPNSISTSAWLCATSNMNKQWRNWHGAGTSRLPWQAKRKNWAPFIWHFDM